MSGEPAPELRKFVAPEFLYGVGALGQAGRYARNFGGKRALVVSDPGVVAAGWTGRALRSLEGEGVEWELFQDVTPNPKDHEVAAGVRFYKESECDVIVAVGGGSPMDCAKGIGIVSANDAHILDFEGIDEVPVPGPPLICIPTTAGSSADVSQFAIISDTMRKVKIAIVSKAVVPDVALIDPETTTTMSAELTASTGLDALVHAVEAYVSNASSPITDLHALEAVSLVAGNLVAAIDDPLDLGRRDAMMLGSLLAGLAFSNASLGLVHAMAHGLGGLKGAPHGMCNAMLLEHVIGFNYSATPQRYDRIAEAMGLDLGELDAEQRKDALLAGVVGLRNAAGVRGSLRDQGVTEGDLAQLAANAVKDPCLATNPRSATAHEIEKLYEEAL
jgi:alcohol dehydrogenase class IV